MSALSDFLDKYMDDKSETEARKEYNDLRAKVASLEARLAEALERTAKLQDELGRSFDNDFGKYKTHHR